MKKMFAILFILTTAACSLASNQGTTSLPSATKPVPATIIASPSPIRTAGSQTAVRSTASPTPLLPTATLIPSSTATQVTANHPWWNDSVFYEIYVRSFFDSNGDGTGDINGLIEKLDYLNDGNPSTTTDLGITGIWLMPIHPSPSIHGYDVTDYYAVNPQYGTLDDFRRLVDEAHRRGIRIIIDLVINHSSSQHPWFIQSQDRQSKFRDWYIWADQNPGWKGPWNQQVWHPFGGDYYYAYFWEGMPDLNYNNPEVTSEMEEITRFWLEKVGIDGFRLDAIGALIEEGSVTVETKASHDWFANYFKFYKEIKPEAMTIGEVWREDAVVVSWVSNQQVDLAFEFDLSAAMLASINEGNAGRLLETLRSGTSLFPKGQYGTFLTNHDMKRVMTQVGGNPGKAKVGASLYFALPGVPFIYYGEEIGMLGKENAQGLMQWSTERFVGFSSVKPWTTFDPNYAAFNVFAETNDPNSLLSHYRNLISLRNSHPVLRTGKRSLLYTDNPGLFACLRTTPDESILAIVNLTGSSIRDAQFSLLSSTLIQGEYAPISLLDNKPLASLIVLDNGRIRNYTPVDEIPPYATIMMLLKK